MKSNVKTITMTMVLFAIQSLAQSPVWSYITEINSQIASIPVVFEGQVTSVEVYPGDDSGNRLPKSAAVWNNNIGYFYDAAGNEASGYSLATIRVCKVYKGGEFVKGGTDFKVLTKSFTLQDVYLLRTGAGADADTTLEFINTPPTHDDDNQFDFILPHVSYPKKIYFADKTEPIIGSNYTGQHFYSNFHTLVEMPFNVPVDVPQPDGTYKRIDAYCAIVPYVFDDQSQLQLFLNQINTINPNPTDYCKEDNKTVGISVVASNGNNIKVYPNPSSSATEMKISFDFEKETSTSYTLMDLSGRKIDGTDLGQITKLEYSLKIDQLNEGMYLLRVLSGARSQTFKITKN